MIITPVDLALVAVAFLAGLINSLAGGGTLFTFPVLLTVMDPVHANATSTLALVPGSLAASWAYRREFSSVKPLFQRLWLPSLIGGILGSFLVTRLPPRIFDQLVPWLLLAAAVLLMLQAPVARYIQSHPHRTASGIGLGVGIFLQFCIGVYGGYFGAAAGILMLALLGFLGAQTMQQMNALKAALAAILNGITAVVFVAEGVVVWRYTIPMAGAAILGGYLGARTGRSIPSQAIRQFVIAVSLAVAIYAFWRRFA
jgi:uncharacterized protein